MFLSYNFYNQSTNEEYIYNWYCDDNDKVFDEVVKFYADVEGIGISEAHEIMIDNYDLRMDFFYEIKDYLSELFEDCAYDDFLNEIVWNCWEDE